MSLAYNLPSDLISAANMRSLRVSVLLNNFFTFVADENLHFDPEQTTSGFYNTVTPIPKTVSLQLNIGL